jgi:hypothetical protein
VTAADVLAGARARGVELTASPEGKLSWRCRGALPEDVRERLAAHKPALLDLLRQEEARRLLAELRAEVVRLGRDEFRGDPPALFRTLAADLVAIGEGYVRHQDVEAARGWDALELLRGLKPQFLATARRARQVAAESEQLLASLTAEEHEAFEERSAVIEHDAGVPGDVARWLALADILAARDAAPVSGDLAGLNARLAKAVLRPGAPGPE